MTATGTTTPLCVLTTRPIHHPDAHLAAFYDLLALYARAITADAAVAHYGDPAWGLYDAEAADAAAVLATALQTFNLRPGLDPLLARAAAVIARLEADTGAEPERLDDYVLTLSRLSLVARDTGTEWGRLVGDALERAARIVSVAICDALAASVPDLSTPSIREPIPA